MGENRPARRSDRGIPRRTVARGVAWSTPVAALAATAPAYAASRCGPVTGPTDGAGVLNGSTGISGALACWGPGEGSGSNGCTGTTEPQRYWVNSDGIVSSSTVCGNYRVWQRTLAYTVPVRTVGVTYTVAGNIMTNWGSHQYASSHGIGLVLQVRVSANAGSSWSAWTQLGHYATRPTSGGSNPMVTPTGCTAGDITWVPTGAPTLVQAANRGCATSATGRFANASFSLSAAAPAGANRMAVRQVWYVAPLDGTSGCTGVARTSDDLAVGGVTVTCA